MALTSTVQIDKAGGTSALMLTNGTQTVASFSYTKATGRVTGPSRPAAIGLSLADFSDAQNQVLSWFSQVREIFGPAASVAGPWRMELQKTVSPQQVHMELDIAAITAEAWYDHAGKTMSVEPRGAIDMTVYEFELFLQAHRMCMSEGFNFG